VGRNAGRALCKTGDEQDTLREEAVSQLLILTHELEIRFVSKWFMRVCDSDMFCSCAGLKEVRH